MSDDFFKFPSTAHLAAPTAVDIRKDKVMTEAERECFLKHELIVEEKVDGANLGISFDSDGNIRTQNRGAYLSFPAVGQWKKLGEWLTPKTDQLFDQLADRFILFGEWCYAQHSVVYDRLPDWFLAFDIFDKSERRFLSAPRRDEIVRTIGLVQVPELGRGPYAIGELEELIQQSKVGDVPAEGIYLRVDQGDWLQQRAKLVRPAFVQAIEEHWSRSGIKPNRLDR